MRRLLGTVAVIHAAMAAAAGCSSSAASSSSIGTDALQKQVADRVEGQLGHAPESLVCPGDLKG